MKNSALPKKVKKNNDLLTPKTLKSKIVKTVQSPPVVRIELFDYYAMYHVS